MNEKRDLGTLSNVEQGNASLTAYERASTALAEARSVDEVLNVRDRAEQMRLYGRQAQDRGILANAMEIQLRAERRLGEMVIEGKQSGLIAEGRPRNEVVGENRTGEEQFRRVTLAEVGVNRKLSSKAQKLAEVPEEQFREVVERAREKVLSGGAVVVNPVKDLNTAEKKVRRQIKEAQLAAQQMALPEKKYGVILADPEWPYETWSDAGMDRAPDNHYPTSALEIIEARDVPSIAHDDAVLFLWVTAPHHAAGNGAMIMRAWGFRPVSEVVWDKVVAGTGFWFRNQHEILMVGTRGSVPAPAMGNQWPSLVTSPKGAHSEKPDWAYKLIEAYFPSLEKIELNARTRRDGWEAWGFEAPDEPSDQNDIPGDALRDRAGVTPALDSSGLSKFDSRNDAPSASSGVSGNSPAGAEGDADRQPDSVAADTVEGSVASGGEGPGQETLPAAHETSGPAATVPGAGEGGESSEKYAPAALPNLPAKPMTREEARPILEAKYSTTSAEELSADLGGVPIPTIRTWAFRLGLTSKARIAQMARDRNERTPAE